MIIQHVLTLAIIKFLQFDLLLCSMTPTIPHQSYIESNMQCPPFKIDEIIHGTVKILTINNRQLAVISCDDGYDLDGNSKIYCKEGQWEPYTSSICVKRCPSPPFVKNGAVSIQGPKDAEGSYSKGAMATYTCMEDYYLASIQSKYRVCDNGLWTGVNADCAPVTKITGCLAPKNISNGYFVHEKTGEFGVNSIGQRLHFSCRPGYTLEGSSVQQCLEDGTWSPKIQPECIVQSSIDNADELSCGDLPRVPHSVSTPMSDGYPADDVSFEGTVVEIHCVGRFRNSKDPCQPGRMKCVNGQWKGTVPTCVPVHDCFSPPPVLHAIFMLRSLFATYQINNSPTKYPIKSEISYQCLPGYALEGNDMLTCSQNGCWLPQNPPACARTGDNYYLEVNSVNAILISAATGAGVLGVLLLICLVIVCKKKKPLTRTISIPHAPIQRPDLGDHAALLHHPDRLALIAFADGMQNGSQSSLPTYDESTRDRGPGLTVNRLHRPHWPNLAGRRVRNSPNPDMVHVTRHGSFASHTPSTRSAGDSMGSTDTMAVSEGSTNVTLDTASSHSGSQPGSCRVHCGSLASFDTCSVINTDDVPLLEESELEEIQVGDNIVDNSNGSDNCSFKIPASADVP